MAIQGLCGKNNYTAQMPKLAEFLEKEMGPEFNQTDMVNADMHRAVCKIAVNNQQTRPFSFTTRVPY
jgi:hypothetical protein